MSARLLLVPVALLLAGCVIDRTGKSVPSQLQRELAQHERRVRELEAVSEDISRRIGQIEEVTRARGQEEILKMETMEQLRQEVARMRGDFEVLQHDYQTYEAAGLGFQQDADSRMAWMESRVAQMEKSLGMKPPPPPVPGAAPVGGPAAAVTPGTPTAGTPTTPDAGGAATTPPPEAPQPAATPEEAFALLERNLAEGNSGAARAVGKRFIAEHPKHDRVPEAHYRIAESYQNEGDFKAAAAAFQVVVDKFPQSTWAPWSVLRQGECFEAMGNAAGAKIFYQDVVKLYPKSKAAKEAKDKLGK